MGTVFSFDVREPGVDRAVVDDVVSWLHHVDRTFSTYRADSLINRLSDDPTLATPEVDEVLAACADLSAETDGFFSAYPNGTLDPSGYVKGWAIERAADLLSAAGSRNHSVVGGGDVQCVGSAAPDQPWRIGVVDPFRADQLLATVTGSDRLAVATSGTAERGAHVFDPHTHRPATALASITVVGTSLARVDALATAAFAMGPDAYAWLATREDVQAFVVDTHGAIWSTGEPVPRMLYG